MAFCAFHFARTRAHCPPFTLPDMSYEVNFGNLTVAQTRPGAKKGQRFRLAVLGDFSGRANRGEIAVGAELAKRKAIKVDCENLDAVIERFGITLHLALAGEEGGSVALEIASIDDLHPDQLFGKLELFSELSGLRKRLKTTSTFAKAAQEVQSWAGSADSSRASQARGKARGSALAVDASIGDFARLVDHAERPEISEASVDELLRRMVAPHVVPAKDPKQDALVAAVDEALSAAMRAVLHHPDFQTTEALLRSIDFLVRRLETDEHLQIVLFDISAEEFAADLSQADALENSGLYSLLIEQPALDAHAGPFAAIVGNYLFEQTPPHAELLGRMARIAADGPAPFLAAIGAGVIGQKPDDVHPLSRDAWAALRAMREAACLLLTTPRFLLRLPYGKKTEPIDSFTFEEFTPQSGLRGMLWGNSGVFAGFLLAAAFAEDGEEMRPGSVLQIDEMPLYYYTDSDGDQIALPCTERLLNLRAAEAISRRGFTPVLAIKGSPEMRLGGFNSVAGRDLAGFWNPLAGAAATPVEEEPAPTPEAAAVSEAEVAAVSEAEVAEVRNVEDPSAVDLDALLADLGGASADAAPAAEAVASAGDDDLDALLASLGTDSDAQAAEGAVDVDLEKLLADLGA